MKNVKSQKQPKSTWSALRRQMQPSRQLALASIYHSGVKHRHGVHHRATRAPRRSTKTIFTRRDTVSGVAARTVEAAERNTQSTQAHAYAIAAAVPVRPRRPPEPHIYDLHIEAIVHTISTLEKNRVDAALLSWRCRDTGEGSVYRGMLVGGRAGNRRSCCSSNTT